MSEDVGTLHQKRRDKFLMRDQGLREKLLSSDMWATDNEDLSDDLWKSCETNPTLLMSLYPNPTSLHRVLQPSQLKKSPFYVIFDLLLTNSWMDFQFIVEAFPETLEIDDFLDPVSRSSALSIALEYCLVAPVVDFVLPSLFRRFGVKILEVPDKEGVLPVHIASRKGLVEFLEKVVDLFDQSDAENILLSYMNSRTTNGWDSLMLAAFHGQVHVVNFLLDIGVDSKRKNTQNQSALELARIRHHDSIVELLSPQ